LPLDPDAPVELEELSWEDRERVLRLLFAKINNVQSRVDALPQHPLEAAAAAAAADAQQLYDEYGCGPATPDGMGWAEAEGGAGAGSLLVV
jgi:hypothetical protein